MPKPISFTQADGLLAAADQMPFLEELKEGPDNALRVVILGAIVEDAAAAGDPCGNPVLDQILAQCSPILPDASRKVEILFGDYILYQVRNESYCSYDEREERTGKYLVQYQKSHLLDYLLIATDACRLEDGSCYPGAWKHYGICTQNHIVDVIAQAEPDVLFWGEG